MVSDLLDSAETQRRRAEVVKNKKLGTKSQKKLPKTHPRSKDHCNPDSTLMVRLLNQNTKVVREIKRVYIQRLSRIGLEPFIVSCFCEHLYFIRKKEASKKKK